MEIKNRQLKISHEICHQVRDESGNSESGRKSESLKYFISFHFSFLCNIFQLQFTSQAHHTTGRSSTDKSHGFGQKVWMLSRNKISLHPQFSQKNRFIRIYYICEIHILIPKDPKLEIGHIGTPSSPHFELDFLMKAARNTESILKTNIQLWQRKFIPFLQEQAKYGSFSIDIHLPSQTVDRKVTCIYLQYKTPVGSHFKMPVSFERSYWWRKNIRFKWDYLKYFLFSPSRWNFLSFSSFLFPPNYE